MIWPEPAEIAQTGHPTCGKRYRSRRRCHTLGQIRSAPLPQIPCPRQPTPSRLALVSVFDAGFSIADFYCAYCRCRISNDVCQRDGAEVHNCTHLTFLALADNIPKVPVLCQQVSSFSLPSNHPLAELPWVDLRPRCCYTIFRVATQVCRQAVASSRVFELPWMNLTQRPNCPRWLTCQNVRSFKC